MASEVGKSWQALLARRKELVDAIKEGVRRGSERARQVLEEAGKQEARVGYERKLSRKDRFLAKKESAGEKREESLLETYEKAFKKQGGLKQATAKLSKESLNKVREAERIDNELRAAEQRFYQMLQKEFDYVDRAKKDAEEVLKDWQEAQRIANRLPEAVKEKNFAVGDDQVYSELQHLFSSMGSKIQQIESYEFSVEQIDEAAERLDATLNRMLQALRGIDAQEFKADKSAARSPSGTIRPQDGIRAKDLK